MVAWTELALPIFISTVVVFFASSLIHMVLKLHNADYKRLSNEDEVRAAIHRGAPSPAQYIIPHCLDPKEAASPEMTRKFEEGPVAVLLVRPNGPPKLGPFLGKWIFYCLVVSFLVGYLARSVCPPGTEYLKVFQVVSVSAWLAFSWGGPADSIWMGKPWAITGRYMFDGLIFGLLMGGVFGWLWP
jgi:hypothetical protein